MMRNARLSKSNSKKGASPFFNTMKKIALVLGLLFSLFLTPMKVGAVDTGATINTMNIKMVANENGLVTVDQTMEYDFTGYNIHGPMVVIPQSYDVNWTIAGDNVTKSYYFPVRNLKVDGSPYTTQTDQYDHLIIYIGDSNVTVSGLHTYHYSYTIQLRDLGLNGLQAFYMNIVGTDWADPIGKVNFSITLP